MSLGHFIIELCSNVWSFLSNRAHKEYLYLFKKGARTSVGDAERGNAYVNEIVEYFITEKAHEYNPYIIENKIYTWLRIPLIVEVEHLETFIEGFVNLYKEKSCKLTEKCGRLYIAANLGAGPFHFTVCAWGKLFHIEQLITITASLNHCKVNADFSLNAKTGRNGRLHSLCIEEFRDVKVCITVTGFRHLSWCLSKLFTLMSIISHRMIRNLVEFELEHYVRKLLPVCKFPIEGKNVNSFSGDRSILSQVEEKSFECSNTNICGKSSSNNVSTTSSGISREAAESFSIKSGKQIIDNTNIHNIADCNKEADSKVEKKVREKQFEDSEVSSELERDSCCTNIPLLQDKDQESETSNKSDDSIRIDITFSNSANMGDVDALSNYDCATCCDFGKYETENLQKKMSEEPNYFPSKHYKRFCKSFKKPNEKYEVGETFKFSEPLDEKVLPDENVSKNKRARKSFFKENPNFIALTYNKCEEQKLEVKRPSFEYNSSSERNQSDSKITLEKDDVNGSLPSKSHKITFNPETEIVKCGELICALPADERDLSIGRVKNVESILRRQSDSEDTEEPKYDDPKNYLSQSYISKPYVPHQNDCSTLTEFLDKQSKISNVKKDGSNSKKKQKSTKSNIHRTDRNVENSILNNSTSLQRENKTDTKVKTTCTSIKQLNVIGDEICRYFENPWLVTIPESTFFFEDNESVAVSQFTCAKKQQEYKLADQPGLLKDTIAKNIGKDVDRTIDLGYILNKTETILAMQNKSGQNATLNSSVKHAAASSDTCTISQVVKNPFEQTQTDNRLLRKNVPLTISGEKEQSFSCSSNVDFACVLKDKPYDLIPDTDKKPHDVFGVEMFNVDPICSRNLTEMTKDDVKRVPCDTGDLSDSLYWGSDHMVPDAGFFSSNSDLLNVSSEKSSYSRGLTENAFPESSETASKITSFTKNKTDADGSCYEKMNVNDDSSAKCDSSVCETHDISQSTTSNPNSDKQLEVNSNIEDSVLSYPLDETFNLERFKQVALNEAIAKLDEAHETASQRMLDLLKVTKKANEYNNTLNCLESITVIEEAYDRIHADIFLLLAEDLLDVSFEKEDSVRCMTDQFSFPRTDIEESRMSYTDAAEQFQMKTEYIKYYKESLLDYCGSGALDVTEIEVEELKYIYKQTEQLALMSTNFARHLGVCKMNTSTDSSLPYRESTLRNIQGLISKHEDTDDTKYLRKDNEFSVKVKLESCGWISDSSVKDPSEECELANVEGEQRLSGDVTDPEMHFVTKDNTPLLKVKDDSSKQSVEGLQSPWKECKIEDGKGRVSWKRAMQIWGVGNNSCYPNLKL